MRFILFVVTVYVVFSLVVMFIIRADTRPTPQHIENHVKVTSYHNYYDDYRFEIKIGGEVKGWSDMPIGFGYLDTMTCLYDFRAPDGSKIDRKCYDAYLPVQIHDKYDDK